VRKCGNSEIYIKLARPNRIKKLEVTKIVRQYRYKILKLENKRPTHYFCYEPLTVGHTYVESGRMFEVIEDLGSEDFD